MLLYMRHSHAYRIKLMWQLSLVVACQLFLNNPNRAITLSVSRTAWMATTKFPARFTSWQTTADARERRLQALLFLRGMGYPGDHLR